MSLLIFSWSRLDLCLTSGRKEGAGKAGRVSCTLLSRWNDQTCLRFSDSAQRVKMIDVSEKDSQPVSYATEELPVAV